MNKNTAINGCKAMEMACRAQYLLPKQVNHICLVCKIEGGLTSPRNSSHTTIGRLQILLKIYREGRVGEGVGQGGGVFLYENGICVLLRDQIWSFRSGPYLTQEES